MIVLNTVLSNTLLAYSLILFAWKGLTNHTPRGVYSSSFTGNGTQLWLDPSLEKRFSRMRSSHLQHKSHIVYWRPLPRSLGVRSYTGLEWCCTASSTGKLWLRLE